MDITRDLYSVAAVRAIDARAIDELGIPGFELMRRAARAGLREISARWPATRRIAIACGPGNNGGDGFLLGALARAEGYEVALVAASAESHGDAALARRAFLDAGGNIRSGDDALPAADVYVDALFGSGLDRALEGPAARLAAELCAGTAPVLAFDAPSGLDADRGVAHAGCVRADVTLAFIAWKRGLFTGQAAEHVGELVLDPLDLPAAAFAGIRADAELLARAVPAPRPRAAHKGCFGHVLVIGGEHGFGGAVRLAAEAALRSGAGLASVATRAAHVVPILAARPELMLHAIEDAAGLALPLGRASVLAVGPGLGQGGWGEALFGAACASGLPLVVDADALNLLAARPRTFQHEVILTPHPGEAARLLDTCIADIEADRFAAVRALAARYQATVVLKGAGSLIATPAGRVAVCPFGNPGMASGGMGDVLTGVVAAWLAQGFAAWDAACLGVGLHARAGDAAAAAGGERGLIASDLFPFLRDLGNASD